MLKLRLRGSFAKFVKELLPCEGFAGGKTPAIFSVENSFFVIFWSAKRNRPAWINALNSLIINQLQSGK